MLKEWKSGKIFVPEKNVNMIVWEKEGEVEIYGKVKRRNDRRAENAWMQ